MLTDRDALVEGTVKKETIIATGNDVAHLMKTYIPRGVAMRSPGSFEVEDIPVGQGNGEWFGCENEMKRAPGL